MLLPIDLNILPTTKGVYLVGGSVRDLLCGRMPVDFDLAVRVDPARFARQLASRTAGRVVEFGKAGHTMRRVVSADLIFDIMPFNGACIEEDLQRRDFTINAMALDLSSGNLIDPTGGRRDLAAHRIRLVSPEAFETDPVRLIRAYRMAAAFEFSIDAHTEAAITRQAHLIRQSAAERIREEFFKILQTAGSRFQLAGMEHSGLLFTVLPELGRLKKYQIPGHQAPDFFEQTLAAYSHLEDLFSSQGFFSVNDGSPLFTARDAARTALIKWAVLFHKIGQPQSQKVAADGKPTYYGYAAKSAAMARQICQRLKFSNRQGEHISLMIRRHRRPLSLFQRQQKTEAIDREFIRFCMQCTDAVPDILLLSLAEFCGTRRGSDPAVAAFSDFIMARIRQYETVVRPRAQLPPPINGEDLIQHFHLKPSADFRYILKRIEEKYLAGRDLTRSQALEMVQDLLQRLNK